MKYLIDSNVLSESIKPEPDARVIAWLRENESEMVIDSVVFGEVLYGILKLPPGRKRSHLEAWFAEGVSRVTCVPWTAAAAEKWAHLVSRLHKGGFTMPVMDTMIAASALLHGLTVATRNVKDFRPTGVKVINPYDN